MMNKNGATVSHLSLLLPAHFGQRTVAQLPWCYVLLSELTDLEAEMANNLKELGYE